MAKQEIAFHFAMNKLEEGYPCGCGKYFWRVYQSPKIEQQGHRIFELLDRNNTSWVCRLCKK